MSKSDPKRAAELGALLARHYPEASIHCVGLAVREMQGAARTAVAWEVKRCNVPMSEVEDERGQARLERLQGRLNMMLAHAPLHLMPAESGAAPHANRATVKLGGDPRGACAFLEVPGLRGDGFGDDYFAIY
jgi:hypothetical protein